MTREEAEQLQANVNKKRGDKHPVVFNPYVSNGKGEIMRPELPVKAKKNYSNKEKDAIEWILIDSGIPYVKEHKFCDSRRWKFDWAILFHKIAIEYEGIYSEKSGHTTMKGYSANCEKYNRATAQGWKVLRYTALNYGNLKEDLKAIIESFDLK